MKSFHLLLLPMFVLLCTPAPSSGANMECEVLEIQAMTFLCKKNDATVLELSKEPDTLYQVGGRVQYTIKKERYQTYEVSEVSEKTITLQRTARKIEPLPRRELEKKTTTVTIDRARRPDLKVGDRVRYDRTRNRLGRTVPDK